MSAPTNEEAQPARNPLVQSSIKVCPFGYFFLVRVRV